MTEVEMMMTALVKQGGGIGSRGVQQENVLTAPVEDITPPSGLSEEEAWYAGRWSLMVFPTKYQALHRNILRVAYQMCEEAGFFDDLRQRTASSSSVERDHAAQEQQK